MADLQRLDPVDCCADLVRLPGKGGPGALASFENLPLHLLTVVDGVLIYALIVSYGAAYDLPAGSYLRSPSIVFLVVYAGVRVLRFDPVPVMVAGVTVLVGWFALLAIALESDAQVTQSYVEFVSGNGVLVGAAIEMAVGFAALVAALTIATMYARRYIATTVHVDDLMFANLLAEENIARQRAILNSSIDGIVIVDQNGNVDQANPAMEQLFGYTRQEMVGKNVAMLMSEENAEGLRMGIGSYLQTGESHLVGRAYESEARHRDGHTIPIELSIAPFTSAGRQMFGGFIRDISLRKQAEMREQLARAQFQDAVTAALDAIIIINETGEVLSFNPAAERIFGFTADDVVGRPMSDFIVPERYRDAHTAGMKRYVETGEGRSSTTGSRFRASRPMARKWKSSSPSRTSKGPVASSSSATQETSPSANGTNWKSLKPRTARKLPIRQRPVSWP